MDYAILVAIFTLGAVIGVMIGAAFCADRPKSRARFDGDYLVFEGPLTPERSRELTELWSTREDSARRVAP